MKRAQPENHPGLTPDETTLVAKLLRKLPRGLLPPAIFHEFARVAVMPIVEVVPLRQTPDGNVEVLLTKREADDPVWPGQLHTPGTVLRGSDRPGSFDDAFERILRKEMNGVAVAAPPQFVTNVFHDSGRGLESSQIYWVNVIGEPTAGTFYNVVALPNTFVASQNDFLGLAVEHFRAIMASA